ncbi:MAG: rhomboid family intramembrane serine protease [Planctomycetes bacterium]|nr:rhomboid family intramembrane serine protease [Planctomycetota bacterium]
MTDAPAGGAPVPRARVAGRVSRFRPPFLVVLVLVLIHAAVHLPEGPTLPARLMRYGAVEGACVGAGEVWRLWSHSLLHANLLHLGLNGVSLLLVGGDVVLLYGTGAFLSLFAGSVLAGGAATCVFTEGLAIGSSAGVMGLFGAVLAGLLRLRRTLPIPAWRRAMKLALVILAVNLAVGLHPQVGQAAHVGGLCAGALLSLWIPLRNSPRVKPGTQGERFLRLLGGASVLSYLAAAVVAAPHVRSGDAADGTTRMRPFTAPPRGMRVDLPAEWLRPVSERNWVVHNRGGAEFHIDTVDAADPGVLEREEVEAARQGRIGGGALLSPPEDFVATNWNGQRYLLAAVETDPQGGGTLKYVHAYYVGGLSGRYVRLVFLCPRADWALYEALCRAVVESVGTE